ncbi:MAG: response regulator [Desulfobacterota bacterium]|nr:response regulator [Thermodesulfobacteriota bacterium]
MRLTSNSLLRQDNLIDIAMDKEEKTTYAIALVDDEPRIHTMIREVLEQGGLVSRFESFYDPFSFIERIKIHGEAPDLVLLDVHFANSGLSGIDCIPHIKDEHPYLPIILLTGMEDADIEQAQDYELVYYIPKPVRPEQLIRMIRFYVSTARKSGTRVAELKGDLEEHKRLVKQLSTELAQTEINTWSADPKQRGTEDRKAFQRIVDIILPLMHRTELSPHFIADLEDLFTKDFPLFKRTVDAIVRFDTSETTPPGMRIHKFHAGADTYTISVTHKARILYRVISATGKKLLLRLDPDHNDKLIEKWLREYLEPTLKGTLY